MLTVLTAMTDPGERERAFHRLASYRDAPSSSPDLPAMVPVNGHPNGAWDHAACRRWHGSGVMTAKRPQCCLPGAGLPASVLQAPGSRSDAPGGEELLSAASQPIEHLTGAIEDPRTPE
ncbi:MAG: hypothetical protein J2P48_17840 [Alphaproteobacteria bacterium]|nr:hypothetical protein [Alphaproteobacteria bacterium]